MRTAAHARQIHRARRVAPAVRRAPPFAQNGAKTAAPGRTPRIANAPGQNAVEGIDVSTEGGKVVLKLKMKEAAANPPASFSLANPPRIAFDFPNTVNALGKSAQDVNENDVRASASARAAGARGSS